MCQPEKGRGLAKAAGHWVDHKMWSLASYVQSALTDIFTSVIFTGLWLLREILNYQCSTKWGRGVTDSIIRPRATMVKLQHVYQLLLIVLERLVKSLAKWRFGNFPYMSCLTPHRAGSEKMKPFSIQSVHHLRNKLSAEDCSILKSTFLWSL